MHDTEQTRSLLVRDDFLVDRVVELSTAVSASARLRCAGNKHRYDKDRRHGEDTTYLWWHVYKAAPRRQDRVGLEDRL